MADAPAPVAIPDGSGSLPLEGAASFASTDNGPSNDIVQDVSMASQDNAGKVAKTADQPTAANLATTTTANTPAGPSSSDAPVESPARAGTATPSSNTMPSTTTTTTTGRAMPAEAVENGVPLRVYLNTKVTQHVTDGMKKLAQEMPTDPLRVLGEFLLKRSAEHEAAPASAGAGAGTGAGEDEEMTGAEH